MSGQVFDNDPREEDQATVSAAIDRALLLYAAFVAGYAMGLALDGGSLALQIRLAILGGFCGAGALAGLLLRRRPAAALAAGSAVCLGAIWSMGGLELERFLPGIVMPVDFACICALGTALGVSRFDAFRPDGRRLFVLFCTLYGQFAFYYVGFIIHRYAPEGWVREALAGVNWFSAGLAVLAGLLLSAALQEQLTRSPQPATWPRAMQLLLLVPCLFATGWRPLQALRSADD